VTLIFSLLRFCLYISLLIVPYSLINFAGLFFSKGDVGTIIYEDYGKFYLYFAIGYFVGAILILSISKRLCLRDKVMIPFLLYLIPVYPLIKFFQVDAEVKQEFFALSEAVEKKFQPLPTDYKCTENRFVRKKGGQFLYYHTENMSRKVSTYDSFVALQQAVKFNLQTCIDSYGRRLQY